MTEDQKTALFRFDMREPSLVSGCLDSIVAFSLAVDNMREADDLQDIPRAMMKGASIAFDALNEKDPDGIQFVAASATDMLYRGIAGLTRMDSYTRRYCSTVIFASYYLLSERGMRTFYILDNTLRDDRFLGLLELFDLAGIATVTPRRDGKQWPGLAELLCKGLEQKGHVAYIEPDAEVNYLDAAKALAREHACVTIFRNMAPEDSQFEVVAWPDSSRQPTGSGAYFGFNIESEVNRYFDPSSLSDVQQPQIVILMGGVASGKTTVRKRSYSAGYVLVDAAEIFLKLSRGLYRSFPKAFEDPMQIIGRLVAQRAISERRHIVTELIGSEAEPMEELIDAMRSIGYQVDLKFIQCDIEQAQRWNQNRGDDCISAYYAEPYQRAWLCDAALAARNSAQLH